MSPDQAEDLAARTLAAIDIVCDVYGDTRVGRNAAADRERVASDLAGLRDHTFSEVHGVCLREPLGTEYPCRDARRYADSLRRTAKLYRVIDE